MYAHTHTHIYVYIYTYTPTKYFYKYSKIVIATVIKIRQSTNNTNSINKQFEDKIGELYVWAPKYLSKFEILVN